MEKFRNSSDRLFCCANSARIRLRHRFLKKGEELMHRKVFIIAVMASLFISAHASAEQNRTRQSSVENTRKGPVAKLVELERRKNEWLRQRMGR